VTLKVNFNLILQDYARHTSL